MKICCTILVFCFTLQLSHPKFLSLVSYVEERPWWPIQSPNKGGKRKEESERLRGERDHIKFIDPRFERWQ